jgi:ABC-type bacteriocin/lantibiotic exporter with double-glycine peptidase domain
MRLAAAFVAIALTLSAAAPLTVPFIRQEKNGCGAASLAMVAHYWRPGDAPPHQAIYDRLIDAERKGILLSALKTYFEEIGFQAFTLRGTWADLEQHLSKGRPIIVALKAGRSPRLHFAVLTGIEEQHIWLNDPTRKTAQRIPRTRFDTQWSGAERWMLLASPRPSH